MIGKKVQMEPLEVGIEEQGIIVEKARREFKNHTSGFLNSFSNLFHKFTKGNSWVEQKRERILEAELLWQEVDTILEESEDEFNLLSRTFDQETKTIKLQIKSFSTNSAWLHTPVLQELHRPLAPNKVLVSPQDAINDEVNTSLGLCSLGGSREERQSALLARVFRLQAFEKSSLLKEQAVIESGPLDDFRAVLAERSIARYQCYLQQLLSLESRGKNLVYVLSPLSRMLRLSPVQGGSRQSVDRMKRQAMDHYRCSVVPILRPLDCLAQQHFIYLL